jgi:signal transduction histidine kinase/CheY-like chemotaxis protein
VVHDPPLFFTGSQQDLTGNAPASGPGHGLENSQAAGVAAWLGQGLSVSEALALLQHAVALAFVLLAVTTTISWLRHHQPALGYLALSIGALALVAVIGQAQALLGHPVPWLNVVSLFAFLASGYALLLFRSAFLPLTPRWQFIALGANLAVAVLYLLANVQSAESSLDPLQTAVVLAAIVVWTGCVGEPLVRFWMAAQGRPAVQQARLRAMSTGYAGLVLVLLVAGGGGAAVRNPVSQFLIEIVALATVPLLHASFSPPGWLRREWRAREEEALRRAMEELLLFSPDRQTLADRALDWAMRLMGAESGLILAADGVPLAIHGVGPYEAAELTSAAAGAESSRLASLHEQPGRLAMIALLPFTAGRGKLVVLAGPFTPIFGSDEVARLEQYAGAIAAALDRAALIEQLRKLNGELERANRHKSVFLANMSHELRTPLNAIIGFSELLLDDAGTSYGPPTRSNFLDHIHGSGKHLLGLINDILDLAKVEAGQMELRSERVRISELIRQVLTTVEPLAQAKGIKTRSQAGAAGTIVADRGKLKQMLLNLVSNAIKFTPEGGRVSIAGRRTDGFVEIAVADTGIGIAEEDLDRIFQEFHQLDSGPDRQQQGTGLGLALTRRFAELHGGRIEVRSKREGGSTFTLVLPVEARTPDTVEPEQAGLPQPAQEDWPLVLVVEDNREAADLLVRHLARGGYRAQVARGGADALDKARSLRPVAITLDILLPDQDGWELLNTLKRDQETRDIPILVVTVVDDSELGRALGAHDYFVKPVDGKALLSRLDQYAFTSRVREHPVKVLVVDDEPSSVDRLVSLLEPAGFTVLRAYGGASGLEVARTELPDLILLDLLMPGINGFDVVSALKSDPSTRDIPVLIVTAKDLDAREKRRLNGQVAAVLQKGSTAGIDLISWLRKLLGERTRLRPA